MNSLGLKSATQSRVNTSCHEGQATWLVSPVSLWGPWAYMPKMCKVIDDPMCRVCGSCVCVIIILGTEAYSLCRRVIVCQIRVRHQIRQHSHVLGENNSITLPLREIYLCSTDIIISGFSNGFNENYPSHSFLETIILVS